MGEGVSLMRTLYQRLAINFQLEEARLEAIRNNLERLRKLPGGDRRPDYQVVQRFYGEWIRGRWWRN